MFQLIQKKIKLGLQFSLAVFFIIAFSSIAKSQDYGKLEWDIVRIGVIFPADKAEISSGVAFSTEARYNISNNISAGLRLAFDAYGSGTGENISDIGLSNSIYLVGDYYFSSDSNKRAFAGIGLGRNNGITVKTSTGGISEETKGDSYFGITPRVGYELGLLRISGEYNFSLDDNVPNIFGIHLGFTIGGKR